MAVTYTAKGGSLQVKDDGKRTLEPASEIKKVVSIVSMGSKDGTPGVHIAALPCPKINNRGLTAGWKILEGLSKAAAVLASTRALQAARQQDKIARVYYGLAEHQWNFYKGNYVPLELQEIDEVNRETQYKADYNNAIKGHNCTELVFDSTEDHRDKIFKEYHVCTDPTTAIRFNIAMSTVKGDTLNFARRYAESLAERRDDIRWNKKMQVATRGRNLLPESSNFANRASGLFGEYSSAMSGLAGDALGFSGYIRNRVETQFNEDRIPSVTRLNNPSYTQLTGHALDGSSRIQAPTVQEASPFAQYSAQGGSSLFSSTSSHMDTFNSWSSQQGAYDGQSFYVNPVMPESSIAITEYSNQYY